MKYSENKWPVPMWSKGTKTSEEERGTFWVLNRRKPLGEVENADKTWKDILDRFPQFKDIFPDIENLG